MENWRSSGNMEVTMNNNHGNNCCSQSATRKRIVQTRLKYAPVTSGALDANYKIHHPAFFFDFFNLQPSSHTIHIIRTEMKDQFFYFCLWRCSRFCQTKLKLQLMNFRCNQILNAQNELFRLISTQTETGSNLVFESPQLYRESTNVLQGECKLFQISFKYNLVSSI